MRYKHLCALAPHKPVALERSGLYRSVERKCFVSLLLRSQYRTSEPATFGLNSEAHIE